MTQKRTPTIGHWAPQAVWWWTSVLPLVWLLWMLIPPFTAAQIGGSGGALIDIYGIVQVEPGSNVLTLEVKDEKIRFAVHQVRSGERRFSVSRFLSDLKYRAANLVVRGPELMLETLIQEKPSKRVLRLRGLYYLDSRLLMLNSVEPQREAPTIEF